MGYADYCYIILKVDTKDLDSVYEDYIVKLLGIQGLYALKSSGYLESCGIVNGRQLFTLIDPYDKKGAVH